MNKLLEKIYTLHLDNEEKNCSIRYLEEKENKKEWDLYDTLYEKLSKEDKEILNDYVDVVGFKHCHEEELAYKDGFIDGALLMIEIFTAD